MMFANSNALHIVGTAPGEYYAKWNKPDSERQIQYDLAYMRNLMNKINQQIK